MGTSYLIHHGYGIYLTAEEAYQLAETIIDTIPENDPRLEDYNYSREELYLAGIIKKEFNGLLQVEINGNLQWEEYDSIIFAQSTLNSSYDFEKTVINMVEPSFEEREAFNKLESFIGKNVEKNYYISNYVG